MQDHSRHWLEGLSIRCASFYGYYIAQAFPHDEFVVKQGVPPLRVLSKTAETILLYAAESVLQPSPARQLASMHEARAELYGVRSIYRRKVK